MNNQLVSRTDAVPYQEFARLIGKTPAAVKGMIEKGKLPVAPMKATQETLDSCKNAGVLFGKALADALMLPLNSFNKLRGGVNWLLEKLGVINKESSDLDQKAAKASAATAPNNEPYIRPNTVYGVNPMYQPVTAPAGKTYVDQSKPEYHITLQGGVAPGSDLDRQLREAVDKLDRENRARQRSSMRHDG
ncbi:Cox family DNA-binding protein [Enterobacter mori]